MILVDTSVWVGHLRAGDPHLSALLDHAEVLCHPWVLGELALGRIRNRTEVLRLLRALPRVMHATTEKVVEFVAVHELVGVGVGWVDATLLASTVLTPDARLWTADKRLDAASARLGVGAHTPD